MELISFSRLTISSPSIMRYGSTLAVRASLCSSRAQARIRQFPKIAGMFTFTLPMLRLDHGYEPIISTFISFPQAEYIQNWTINRFRYSFVGGWSDC